MNQYTQQLLSQVITNPLLDPAIQTSGGGISFFQGFLPALVNLGFIIGSVVFFFMLLSGGIQWMTSGGDKVAVENARKRLTNAIIGLLILFFIFAFVNLLETFLGVSILELDIGILTGAISGPGGPGGPGNALCPCSPTGGCASIGQVGLLTLDAGPCYDCTSGGWSLSANTSCGVISCGTCP